ncbi:MAG: T9SS type A sorting domain-containing protein [Thiohalospira sp.]
MKRVSLFSLILLCFFSLKILQAQNGKILIIGGGSENITSTTSWNYEAFNWAVDQSSNKKVAILHYSTTTSSSFEDYFIDYCDASEVKSFVVNSSGANNTSLINEILEYDVFYLRGGDQWYYYSYWKGTLMEDAIHNKYNNGGVICGTSAGLAILSGVMFTAQYSSAYSHLCIKNTNHVAITLKNDFIEIMPGFIFDSHFTNRGRMGRLISFMAHWKKNNGENIVGIGVDEISALAIDENKNATVFGAGIVGVYRLREGTDYYPGTVLNVDSLNVIHLSHGKTINLNDFSVGGFSDSIETDELIETTPSKIFASGSDNMGDANINLLQQYMDDGEISDPIIIFSGSETGIASEFKQKLLDYGATDVKIYIADNSTSDDAILADDIANTSNFIFVDNNTYNFITLFYNSGEEAGNALKNAFKNRELKLAFIGDNARFCGSVIINNYIGSYANANTSQGLGLLNTLAIIPKTFELGNTEITDLWHATNASLPYALVKEKLKNGIWLNEENYLIFHGENDKAKITIYGTSPAMALSQNNTKGELITQTYSGTGSPDKKASFDQMYLSFLIDGQEYILGDYESSVTSISQIDDNSLFKIYPNPVTSKLKIKSEKDIQLVRIYNIVGTVVYSENYLVNNATIDIKKNNIDKGVYIVEVINWDDKKFIKKIIVN